MRLTMKTYLVAPVILLAFGSLAHAQDVPAVVVSTPTFGFSLPSVEGTLTYSLNAAESVDTGYGTGGVDTTTSLSGSLGYLSSSPDKPFSLVYSGGYLYSTMPGYPGSSTFQNLAASQVLTTRNWNFVVDDAVSYLPESPTTGLSGIPGVGDIGVEPVQIGDVPAQNIFTNYATRLGNGLSGSATRKISADLSMNASGSWQILHFFGNDGIDSSTETGSAGPSFRIDARSSVGANVNYTYTNDTYLGNSYPFESEGISVSVSTPAIALLQRERRGGPAEDFWIRIDGLPDSLPDHRRGQRSPQLRPQKYECQRRPSSVPPTPVPACCMVRFRTRSWAPFASSSAATGRGPSRPPTRRAPRWRRSRDLNRSYQSIYGGGQLSRRLSRSFSAYFSYTAVTQSENIAGIHTVHLQRPQPGIRGWNYLCTRRTTSRALLRNSHAWSSSISS